MFFPEYDLRIRGVEALRRVISGSDPRVDLIELGMEVVRLGERLHSPAGGEFAAWGELLRAIGHLARWGGAVREAEIDSDRHLRAAKQRAQDVLGRCKEGTAMGGAASAVVGIGSPDGLRAAATELLRIRMPLPFSEGGMGASESPPESEPHPTEASRPILAFLQFYMGESEVSEPHDLKPNILYDLRLEMRLSEIPEGVKLIEVTPYTVEPEGIVDAPTFLLGATDGETTLSGTGRLRVHVAHDAVARPLEISYGAQAISPENQKAPLIKVQGQSNLLFRCVDESNRWRGNRGIEDALIRARDSARPLGLPDSELSLFLKLLGAVGVIAADSLANNIFTGEWPEERFHSNLRSRLSSDPTIGSELEDHPKAGGGVCDLSLQKIRLELKVDPRAFDIDDAFEMYGQQLAQYAVGSDRRSGVLVVLCGVKEGLAPGSIENDIGLRIVSAPSGGDRSVAIGVVMIRRDLPAPSVPSG